jgi:hypothetical protein
MMNVQASPRKDGSSNAQVCASRTGRHARPVSPSVDVLPDSYRNLGIEQLRAVDRAIREAHIRVRGTGVGSDAVTTALALARTNLSEAREILQQARKELLLVHHEYDELNRRLANPSRYPVTATPAVPDTPGLDLCPDPGTAQTPAEYMDAFRTYRLWAGNMSYRALESVIRNQRGQHFSSSTLHAALTSNDLPALALVQAVITALGGGDAHQQMFASAWRRLTMSQQNGAV